MAVQPVRSSSWSEALDDLIAPHMHELVQDPGFINKAFDPGETNILPPTPQERMNMLVGEARQALRMIEPYLFRGMRILEIGGGAGLVYALLHFKGYGITSLEPGTEGFGDRHQAGLSLLRRLNIDARDWIRKGIDEFLPGEQQFDLVFSYFVLEHLPDLNQAFSVMSDILSPAGLMIHCCPNYAVPFEPHYNIPLIPFRPGWTAFFRPGLRAKGLWQGLNFISVRKVVGLCARHGLQAGFKKGMSAQAFERVLADPLFSSRKPGFAHVALMLKKTGLLRLLRRLPPSLDTPMQFTAIKKDV